jgi:hypothetical protein
MSEAAPSPEQPEDLETQSTPNLATRLLAELEIRHQKDVFILLIARDTDGDRPAIFERFIGCSYAVEGMLGGAYRHVKHGNDRNLGRWRGDKNDRGFYEDGPVPGSNEAEDE